ncbi:hypothetical protein DENSPDRAFT_792196 [Dentipellis sp. KUC8613]|nr:hypothetical protein DENSPDRAFT_792196 [Dentipellis sp. KUC8613]
MKEDRLIDLKIIRGRDIRSSWRWKSSMRSFVLVTPGGKQLFRTEAVGGQNPEWNEVFVIKPPSLSATVRLQVFRSTNSSEMVLLGETDVLIDSLLRDEVDEVRCRLAKPGVKILRNQGEIFVSGKIHVDGPIPPSDAGPTLSTTLGSADDSLSMFSKEAVFVSRPHSLVSRTALRVEAPAKPHLSASPPLPDAEPSQPSTALLNQAADSVGALSAPPLLEKLGSSTGGVATDDVFSQILEGMVHLGDAFADVYPYAKIACVVLSSGYKALKRQVERDSRVRDLWNTVQDVVTFLDDAKTELGEAEYLKQVVSDVLKQIYESCQFVVKYARHGFAGRTLLNTLNPSSDDTIRLLTDSFLTLKEQLVRGVSLENWKAIRLLGNDLGEAKDQIQDIWLYTLIEGQSNVVECDTSRGCLPGTRTKLINDITEWIHDPSRGRVLWLSGAVGTGKSSVANTISGLLKGLGRLGASFRFDRQLDPSAVFRQIAYQLARIDPSVKDAILSVLKQKGDIASAPLSDQAMRVVVEPLRTVDLVGPIVIVVDALDEINHADLRVRDDILSFFSNEDFALPEFMKVLITSRDDPHIHLHLQTRGKFEALRIDDYEDTPADILFFIQHRLSEIRTLAEIAKSWPPVGADRRLAERADKHFIWAHITCQFIAESPRSRLPLILSTKASSHDGSRHLDVLYDSVLRAAFETRNRNPKYLSEFKYVVGCIAVGRKSFRLGDLNDMLGLRDDCYREIRLPGWKPFSMEGAEQLVSSVRCLFHETIMPKGSNVGSFRLIHTSLFEFLSDEERCRDFHIDLPYWNLILAIQCVKILNRRLDVEIPGDSDQSYEDDSLGGLPVSGALRYACQYFAHHISDASDHHNNLLVLEITSFSSTKLLRWIKTASNLRLEWMESLDILLALYDLPQKFKSLGTATAEERQYSIALMMDESLDRLSGMELTVDKGESRLRGRYSMIASDVALDASAPDRLRPWFRAREVAQSSSGNYTYVHRIIEHTVASVMHDTDLSDAAFLLLGIWDALENLFDPRQRYLELTRHCTQILQKVSKLYLRGSTVNKFLYEAANNLLRCLEEIHAVYIREGKMTHAQQANRQPEMKGKIASYAKKLSNISRSFQTHMRLQSTREALLNLQDLDDYEAYMQIHELAKRVLTSQEDDNVEFGIDTNFRHNLTSLLRRITEGAVSGGANSGLQVITRYDLDIGKVLSRSADNTVYRAVWRDLDEPVALKVFSDTAVSRRHFGTIVKTWWRLSDPNVIQLLGVSAATDLDVLYTVVPYCKLGNLVQYLKSMPEHVETDLLWMTHDVISGLEYLHEKGIVHGNLQSENVLVTDDYTCLLSGFGDGLAFVSSASSQNRAPYILRDKMLGWYAPEVLEGDHPFRREADVYAFAMVCVEIVKGGIPPWPPFSRDMMHATVCVKRRRPRLPPSTFLEDKLKGVIRACWAYDCKARPNASNARSLLRDVLDELEHADAEQEQPDFEEAVYQGEADEHEEYTGEEYVGEEYVGEEYASEEYAGEEYTGEEYTGEGSEDDEGEGEEYTGEDDDAPGEESGDEDEDEDEDSSNETDHGTVLNDGAAEDSRTITTYDGSTSSAHSTYYQWNE